MTKEQIEALRLDAVMGKEKSRHNDTDLWYYSGMIAAYDKMLRLLND